MRFILPIVVALGSLALGRWTFNSPLPPAEQAGGRVSTSIAITTNGSQAEPPSDSRPQGATRSLTEAFAGDDPFLKARRLKEWIESATLDDLRQLAADPKHLPDPGSDWGLHSLFLEGIATRWLALNPEGALQEMKPIDDVQERQDMPDTIYTALARLRPKLILDQTPLLDNEGNVAYPTGLALCALATTDANAARRYLDRFTDPSARREAEISMARGAAANDPVIAVTMAKRLDAPTLINFAMARAEELGPAEIQRVLMAADGRLEGIDLPRLLAKYPDLASSVKGAGTCKADGAISDDLRAVAETASPEERARLLEQYDALPADARQPLGAALAMVWARIEPQKAAEWALAHSDPNQDASGPNLAADKVFIRWFTADPGAAFDWWQTLPPSRMRDSLGNDASAHLAENGNIDQALALFHPCSDADATIATQLAQIAAKEDPAKAAGWLSSLPSGVDLTGATTAIVSQWYSQQPDALSQWAAALPPGKLRDTAVSGLIGRAAQQDPAEAAGYLDSIGDPAARQLAAGFIFVAWKWKDPQAAAEWASRFGLVKRWRMQTWP